jgi:hypothetical protein
MTADGQQVLATRIRDRPGIEWARLLSRDLGNELGDLRGLTFEIHAGRAYTDYGVVSGLTRVGAHVELPVAGLGLGEQLSFYASARSDD